MQREHRAVSLLIFAGTGRNVVAYPRIIILVLRAGMTGGLTSEAAQPAVVSHGRNAPVSGERSMAWSRSYMVLRTVIIVGTSARNDEIPRSEVA